MREKYSLNVDHTQDPQYTTKDFLDLSSLEAPATEFEFYIESGVFQLKKGGEGKYIGNYTLILSVIQTGKRFEEYLNDFLRLYEICASGPAKTFSYDRLKILEYRFLLHESLNAKREREAIRIDPKDFSNVIKVDTRT
jgi:hypothetical protein